VPFKVFPTEGLLRNIDVGITHAGLTVLAICFLIALACAALDRFQNFSLDSKVQNLFVLAFAVGLWPLLMDSIGGLVDLLNGFLIRILGVEDLQHIDDAGAYLAGVILDGKFPSGIFTSILVKIVSFIFIVAKQFLHWIFLIFYFGFKILGPLIIGRCILSNDLTAFKALLSEVSILYLWQTTFVLLIGFVSLIGRGGI